MASNNGPDNPIKDRFLSCLMFIGVLFFWLGIFQPVMEWCQENLPEPVVKAADTAFRWVGGAMLYTFTAILVLGLLYIVVMTLYKVGQWVWQKLSGKNEQ